MLSCILIAFDERLPLALTRGALTIKPVKGPNGQSEPPHPPMRVCVCVLYIRGLASVKPRSTHEEVT